MGRWDDDWDFYDRKPARAVRGGIKAHSKRGAFGESWWARRWVAVLESFEIGSRLDRGRSYARKGQVMNIEIGAGSVKARVQGSAPRPYGVSIKLKPLAAADWQRIAEALAREALFAAKLLAGEMPPEIERVFTETKLSLFPAKLRDLETQCSCPDWSNPCKHLAAVYYLLGEEFDRDPFLIFKLRGIEREEFIKLLGARAGKMVPGKAPRAAPPPPPPEPLTTDLTRFWGDRAPVPDPLGEVRPPPMPAPLLKRLGNFPFWRGSARFDETLEPVYQQASPRGMEIFLGERAPGAGGEPTKGREEPPALSRPRRRS